MCPFDPSIYVNVPLGMFHCPLCGDMIVAGLPHPPSLSSLDFSEGVASLAELASRAIHGEVLRHQRRWRIR